MRPREAVAVATVAPRLVLGTDGRQAATGSARWAQQQAAGWSRGARAISTLAWSGWGRRGDVGPDGIRGSFPTGTGHAVPAGGDRALCGRADQYVWAGRFNASSRVVTPCATCSQMSKDRG